MRIRSSDLKEKLIVFGAITCIFLPIRMTFYVYFSAYWVGSLGLVSSLMFLLIFLAHKQKLGRFGNLFLNHLTKTIKGKSGKIAITFSFVLIAYFASTLVWIERGNTIYSDEKHLITQIIFSHYDADEMNPSNMHAIMNIKYDTLAFNPSNVIYVDQIMSITYAIMNDMMGGWISNIDLILLVEQFEFLGFMVLYRKIYNPSKTLLTN